MDILIIGGGIAGTTAAEELRKRLPDAQITILEQEQHPLYSRVLLPHYIKGKIPRERVFLRQPEWYAKERIELITGIQVLVIDAKNKFVGTSDGREYPFDKLLLATGGEPRLLPDDHRGVSYLHSLDDADHLLDLLAELKTRPLAERQAGVYGGAFIACEYANFFQHHGIPFTLFLKGRGFWSKTLSPESQLLLRQHASGHGARLVTGVEQIDLLGEDQLTAVRTNGEEFSLALLGIGIGSTSDEQLLQQAGVALEGGIAVNAHLETNLPDVWAAGDATALEDSVVGRRVRYGNWQNAMTQGRVAAQNMAGERTPFRLTSQYSTNLLGLHIVFIGDVAREAADQVKLVSLTKEASEEHFIRDGKLVGAVLLGDLSKRGTLVSTIGQRYDA